ncbi:pre-mRNA-processing factor 39-like [Anguilla rostrata]|uniref:pre-mRNA-processing factor 39-like n=1 Tax=Anguilla rostrata TaxID=7938 RepID=UPI0030D417A1
MDESDQPLEYHTEEQITGVLNSEPMGIYSNPGSEGPGEGCQPDPPVLAQDPTPAQGPGFESVTALQDGGQDEMEQTEEGQSELLVRDLSEQPGPPQEEPAQQLELSEQGSPSNMELEDTSKDGVEAETEPSNLEAAFPEEFDRYMKVVEENPEEFNGWTYLLQYVEQENHIVAARTAFDSFFARYPYCYGYWKKYADMERKLGDMKLAEEVFRRGLQAIPLSVDLWLHYIAFLKETADTSDNDIQTTMRNTYESAVLAAGTDFRSDRLWEAYINWETEMENLANVTAIYDRVLTIPTQLYNHHFQRFREHVQNNLPKHFLSLEEFVQLRKELAAANGHGTEESPEGGDTEDLPPGTEDLADPAKLVTEIENMRHRVTESRQEVFNLNEQEVSKRWEFEEGIKRPYFHVKPLEKSQLNNWKEYLDFEIENGTLERVVVLFERCLVACALYEDLWIKYAKYMEIHSTEAVRHVYKRASLTHLPKKPTLHLLWAAFEEQQGNVDDARGILRNLEEAVPGLAMVRLRRVNLERRHGNLEESASLLQDAIANGKNVSESSFYSIKLARHLFKVQKSLQKARKVLLEAIEKDKTSSKLYLNLLELEYSGDVRQSEEQILSCFDRALSSPLPLESRLTFSQRKVEFLEDFGSDVNMLVTSYEEHQKLLKEHESTKRKAENGSQEPDPKKQRTEDHAMTTGPMMPDMQANHSAYNYNWYQQYNYQNPWGYGHYYPPPPT